MATIAAVITARDAATLLPEVIASVRDHVDEIVVGVDDRTVDETRVVARDLGAKVHDVSFMRDGVMDFAQARNQTMTTVEADWFIWIDTDDVLVATIPLAQLIADAEAARPGVETIWLPYLYSRDALGNVNIRQYRERVIRTAAAKPWIGRLHETCPTENGPRAIWAEANLDYDTARVYVDHKNRKLTEAGKWDRNFPILMKMVEEDPNDLRAVREVAEAYFAATQWAKAIEWYDTYLDRAASSPGTAVEERWISIIYKAKCERMLGRFIDAMRTADRAYLMCPQYADSCFELMYGYVAQGHWTKAIYWFNEGLERDRPDGIFGTSPFDYECAPYRIIHQAYYEVGDLPKAIECVEHARKYLPDDPDLVHSITGYVQLHMRNEAVAAQLRLIRYLCDNNEPLKARTLLQNLPAGAHEDYPEVAGAKALVDGRLAHMDNDRAYRSFYVNDENTTDPIPDLNEGHVHVRMAWILQRLQANGCKRILNVGLGSGFDSLLYAKAGIQVVGIDVDWKRVRDCNWAAVRMGMLALKDAPDYSEQATAYDEATHPHTTWTADCEQCGPVRQLPDIQPDSIVQFHFADAEKVSQKVRGLGPYDAVVMAELIEHVRDVDKIIEQAESLAPLVIITTPDGTAPQVPYPSHVRSYSQKELEQLVWTRGQLIESHFIAGQEDQIAVEYRPNVDINGRMPVVIFCGPGLEKWSPEQIDRDGLGGSETAVVYLSRELVARGFRVMVYAEAEGVWDGVFYRHHSRFVPENPVGIFIAWRNPTLVDLSLNADRKLLWFHDVDAGEQLTEERAAKFDGLMVLSEFHRRHLQKKYPFIPEDKYTIIGNGIDPSRFAGSEERDPNRFVYVSSPDRGLERLLVMWPFIEQEYPEAALAIFYGWENYDRLGRDPGFKAFVLDKANQPGVEWHGRIGQRELARELMRSGGLVYPGPHPFEETFCISVIEAQAAGCVPVTRDNGALPETNAYGTCLSNAYATVLDYAKAMRESAEMSAGNRAEMAAWAQTHTWAAVAERFLAYVRATYPHEVAA
jgi:glycosyltransferase involved in cell wall biosynthesis/tetratricopeptide (TPR) repeat protein